MPYKVFRLHESHALQTYIIRYASMKSSMFSNPSMVDFGVDVVMEKRAGIQFSIAVLTGPGFGSAPSGKDVFPLSDFGFLISIPDQETAPLFTARWAASMKMWLALFFLNW